MPKELTEIRTSRMPVAFFEDTESRGQCLLVAGHPTQSAMAARFTLTPAHLPGSKGSRDLIQIKGARLALRAATAIEFVTQVPPNDLAWVRIQVAAGTP